MKVSCASTFSNKSAIPNDGLVADALGAAFSIWDKLRSHVTNTYPDVVGEWKHYGKASGWTYRMISKKRNLLFFVPQTGCFRLRIVLGEKASACADGDKELPGGIKDAIRQAVPYAEGRSIDIDVNRHDQLEAIKRLLKIKYEN